MSQFILFALIFLTAIAGGAFIDFGYNYIGASFWSSSALFLVASFLKYLD